MTKKIEVNEDDLKKVILMLKLSKAYLQLPSQDLFLTNLWRVAPKLADKLMRKAELVLIQNKGRLTLKPLGEVPDGATIIGGGLVTLPKDKPAAEKQEEVSEKPAEEAKEETPNEVTDTTEAAKGETEKAHRCRKRKPKA